MRSRYEIALKLLCLALAGIVLYQAGRLIVHTDPGSRLKLPVVTTSAVQAATPPGQTNTKGAVPMNAPATNAPAGSPPGTNTPPRMATRMPPGAAKAPDLPPAIQSRVDRITQSEILGPVVRPLPMALLGIAGNSAFIRAPNGQTGLLAEGEELGGIKLLRIGTNRVLVEEGGQKKELTVFAGLGGESLAPVGKETPQ